MSEVARHLRAAALLAGGAFFLLGPIHPQALGGTQRSSEEWWRPMTWHMYHSVGLDTCQANFWAVRDGQRVDYTKKELSRGLPALGGKGKYGVGRRVREHDVQWQGEDQLPEMARLLCEREPSKAPEVHAYARCAPPWPGGKWKELTDGSPNLCPAPK